MSLRLPALLIAALSSACAAPAALSRYPRQKSEQPIALPDGLSRWKPVIVGAANREPRGSTDQTTNFYPWYWEQGVSDRFNLIWFPIPLAARYAFHQGEETELAVSLNLIGEPYYRGGDFNWSPYVQFESRHRLGGGIAFDSALLFQGEVRRGESKYAGSVSWKLGPWLPVLASVSLRPYLDPMLEARDPRARYLGSLPPFDPATPHFRLPLGAELSWRAADQWELNGDFRVLRVAFPQGYQSLQAILNASYFF